MIEVTAKLTLIQLQDKNLVNSLWITPTKQWSAIKRRVRQLFGSALATTVSPFQMEVEIVAQVVMTVPVVPLQHVGVVEEVVMAQQEGLVVEVAVAMEYAKQQLLAMEEHVAAIQSHLMMAKFAKAQMNVVKEAVLVAHRLGVDAEAVRMVSLAANEQPAARQQNLVLLH